jgi:hypothetical protein
MLREIEYFATLASIHAKDYKYPKKDIDDMWENVLLYPPTSDETDIDVNSTTFCQGVQLKWSTTMPEKFPSFPPFSQTNVDLRKSIQHGPTITQRGIERLRIQRQSYSPRRKTPSCNKHTPLAPLRNRIPSQQRNSRRSKRRRKAIRCCLR